MPRAKKEKTEVEQGDAWSDVPPPDDELYLALPDEPAADLEPPAWLDDAPDRFPDPTDEPFFDGSDDVEPWIPATASEGLAKPPAPWTPAFDPVQPAAADPPQPQPEATGDRVVIPVDFASTLSADPWIGQASADEPLEHIPYTPEPVSETVRRSGLAYSAGIVFVVSVAFMLLLGWLADLLFGSSPWGVVGGIILGSVIGFMQFFRITSRIFKSDASGPQVSPLTSHFDDEP